MPTSLIGLGSNVGDRRQHLLDAISQLSRQPGVEVRRKSSWYETAALGGPAGQDPFLNGAICVETSLSPEGLLDVLQAIERGGGRERSQRWGPRTIDLDILLYDEQVLQTEQLTIPHPRMVYRRFVLEPAVEVGAYLVHPHTGWTVAQLLEHLNQAPPYVAIAAAAGMETTKLASKFAARTSGRLITGPGLHADQAIGSAAEFRQSITAAHDSLQQCAPEMDTLAVSDFWFDQLLADATCLYDERELEPIRALWAELQEHVLSPKLTLWLDAPAAWICRRKGKAKSAESRATPVCEESVECFRAALATYVLESKLPPWIRLDATDEETLDLEITAALEAIR